MPEIRTLREGTLDDVLALYNRGIAGNRYSGRLDAATWDATIAAKPYDKPEAVMIAYEGATARGYTHLCHGPNADRTGPDPATGSVEALFFDPDRPDVGLALLREAVERHRAAGATKVFGWSSFSGYPLYRGIFVGLEPMAMAADRHVVESFLAAGFAYCQRSVEIGINFDAPVPEQELAVPVEFRVGPWQSEQPWDAATWQGLTPYRNCALIDGREVASCLYAMMPVISSTYGAPVGCIGGLRTQEDWRRKGIAAFLVSRALNHMRDLGARRVTVGTQHDNWAAHATYRRLGMVIETDLCAFSLNLDGEA